jgi:hypothetical protein
MCTIVSSQTHQPAIVPVAQHGSLDDCVYVSFLPLCFYLLVIIERTHSSRLLLEAKQRVVQLLLVVLPLVMPRLLQRLRRMQQRPLPREQVPPRELPLPRERVPPRGRPLRRKQVPPRVRPLQKVRVPQREQPPRRQGLRRPQETRKARARPAKHE